MNKNIQRWLELSCSLIPGVHSAVFFKLSDDGNQASLLAKWPRNLDDYNDLNGLVKHVSKKKTPLCLPEAQTTDGQLFDFFALPLLIESNSVGVIALKVKHLPESKHKAVLHNLKRHGQWLRLINDHNVEADNSPVSGNNEGADNTETANNNSPVNTKPNENFYSDAVGIMASCLEQDGYHKTLLKMVVAFTGQFNCDRVAFAEYNQHHCKVMALSNSADFDQRANLIQSIANAMDEAIEQDNIILFPQANSQLIERAHIELARKFGSASICTIPLIHNDQFFGAVMLLSNEIAPLNEEAINFCQQALSLITPSLVMKRDQEKSILIKLFHSMADQLKVVFGFKFLKLKLAAIFIASILIASNLIKSEYQISADAILEGKIQRVIAAPMAGYVLSAKVRAGDTVLEGDIMASLNDSDLRLEQAKLNGRLEKAKREYREAQSSRSLVKVRVVKEQMNQINAEIDQNNEILKKINLIAPFDGIVIEGDLSQLLGSPVERGGTLFKIAPLEGYRIILKVNEKQISSIKLGQKGVLALSSIPSSRFEITIEKITAVARAEDGANIFRVEASLENAPDLMRPGMEGVGRINAGQASLWWIWTHKIRDSLGLWLWSWLP